MKNGEKEGFDVNDVSAYVGEIEKWRDDLRDMATGALQMKGIEESERYNLKKALDSLRSIDELVKIIGERPYAHVQAHALSHLWSVLGAAFVIGSRAVKNPISGKIQTKKAHESKTMKSQCQREIVGRCAASLWERKPIFWDNAEGTAAEILSLFNGELSKANQKQVSKRVIRGHVTKLIYARVNEVG
jgi:hypothetical protein